MPNNRRTVGIPAPTPPKVVIPVRWHLPGCQTIANRQFRAASDDRPPDFRLFGLLGEIRQTDMAPFPHQSPRSRSLAPHRLASPPVVQSMGLGSPRAFT